MNEPAFPTNYINQDGSIDVIPGMSKRFYAAVQIAAKLAFFPETKSDPEHIAVIAFEIADALIEQEKEETK